MSDAPEPSAPGAKKMAREEVTPWSSGDPAFSEEKSVPGASAEEIETLKAFLQQQLSGWGPLIMTGQRLLVWEQPLPSMLTGAAIHGAFWFFSYVTPRPVFLLSFFLLCLLGVDVWKPWLLRHCRAQPRVEPPTDSEAVVGATVHHCLLTLPELCHYLAETWFTSQQYIQEMMLYKKQNPGKFCAMVCACCSVLAVVGHYVPGIMVSYIIVLSGLLWPLVVYREVIQRMYTTLEPALMKLDYSMKGEDILHSHKTPRVKKWKSWDRVKWTKVVEVVPTRGLKSQESKFCSNNPSERQSKNELEGGQEVIEETDSESEIELSGLSPQMDVRITALALSITDSELSDEEASILESGGFSVSRATTPQLTDVLEDLDQPAAVAKEPAPADPTESPLLLRHHVDDEKHLPPSEMPLLPTEQLTLNPEELLPTLISPLHFVHTHFNGKGQPPQQEGDHHLVGEEAAPSPITPAPSASLEHSPSQTVETEEVEEEFELLDHEELELIKKELEEVEKQLAASKLLQQEPEC